MLESLEDEYLRQRAEDVKMISKMVLALLQGKKESEMTLESPAVIVADKINPNQLAELNRENVLGLVTSSGGITDHTSIVAKALGIPYIIGVKEAINRIADADLIVIDTENQCVHVNPSQTVISKFERVIKEEKKQLEKALKNSASIAQTKSGKTVQVLANVGSVEEAIQALKFGADGIGLLRTELCFLEQQSLPSEKD
jgi:phosphotransferase system enzyme I (PtsI)